MDYDRKMPMIWLGALLAVLAVVLARWRGVLALCVGLSLLLVTKFLIPALLAGSSPLLVSLVGASAVMFLTLVMTSGFGIQTFAAALGIGATLLLTTLLGTLFAHLTHLNGYTSELSTVLPQAGIHISIQGVVLAGMIVGALGVLADMAVSQASAVMAIRRANPALGPGDLYRGAFVVGRDHLSATIHTLVLAYVGAALPLLLIIQGTGVGVADAFNFQDIAEPIVPPGPLNTPPPQRVPPPRGTIPGTPRAHGSPIRPRTSFRASSISDISPVDSRSTRLPRREGSTAPSCGTRTRVLRPRTSTAGWRNDAAALADVGATTTVDDGARSLDCTTTAYRRPRCSRPRRPLGGLYSCTSPRTTKVLHLSLDPGYLTDVFGVRGQPLSLGSQDLRAPPSAR